MLKIIKKKTRGKGVKDVIKGGQRALLQSCLNLATYVDNYSANDAFSKLYLEITKILGIIGNSYQTDLGDKITKSLSSSCDQYVSQKGYQDISTNSEDVKSTIQTAKSDRT
ncbi:hypothetical protein P5F04_16375, partial [Clostridium perfringens]|nr:hypothetical protein [Clostridium perfringens]